MGLCLITLYRCCRTLLLFASLRFFIYAIFLSYDTCKILIHAFVTARIDYCNSLLYGQPKCILKRLQKVLNSAARLIHLTSRYEHVTPLLIQLHWLPIEQRITFKIAVITFKALHGAAPSYITDLIKPYTTGRLLRSSNQFLLSTSKFNLKTYGGRFFTIAAPSVWNALPFELRSCNSLSSFKSKLGFLNLVMMLYRMMMFL